MLESNITPIGTIGASHEVKSVPKHPDAPEGTFGQWLTRSLAEVNQMQETSDSAAQKLITGQSSDIHGTMIAMQKAGIALDLVMEVRNKVIAAYDEVKRMQF
jgi:flagellar hook-basal body complex protein FliE